MTKVVVDEELRTRLNGLTSPLELCDENGRTLGFFRPLGDEMADESPFSDDELKQRARQRTGRPLADILNDLQSS